MQIAGTRPPLDRRLTGGELRRWYWLHDELRRFARELGMPAGGSKQSLTDRIAAELDGAPFAEPRSTRPIRSRQLSGPLDERTVIPRGQRCSQLLRGWFEQRTGRPFRFDAAMRAFFADTDGSQTLQDALDHFRATRDEAPRPIGPQFEYNRFLRQWHEQHPGGSPAERLAAWRVYRQTPADRRPAGGGT